MIETRMPKKPRKNRIWYGLSAGILIYLSLFLGFLGCSEAPSTLPGQPTKKTAEATPSTTKTELSDQPRVPSPIEETFVYKREGRQDPFMPLVTSAQGGLEPLDTEEMTGLRLFEPGQLTLVAIASSGDGTVAMVQDSSGKGYTVRQGTLIGKLGEVGTILADRLVINERYYTLAGEERIKAVEMLLRKEGEQE